MSDQNSNLLDPGPKSFQNLESMKHFQKPWAQAPDVSSFEQACSLLLEKRDLTDHEKIQHFLKPSLTDLHSPWEISGMEKAVERIKKALENQERIMVFGDFDADGITSTVILVSSLREMGGEVSYRVPDRHTDSHGLKKHHVDEILDQNVSLLITCDCGVNDRDSIGYGAEKGMDVIVTDHHEPEKNSFPEKAIAVLDPRLDMCSYPEKNLSGSGIAFKLVSALGEKYFDDLGRLGTFLQKYLEMCAVGLIADCVDLTGENRILARFGLEKMKDSSWPGLKQLFLTSNVDPGSLSEETIGFTVAPKLNAASRIGDVKRAIELFLGEPRKNMDRITMLNQWNEKRKQLTKQAFEESVSQVHKDAPFQMLHEDSWNQGLLGLIAGRQAEHLGVPVIATSLRSDGMITGSCRSANGYSIVEALGEAAEFLDRFGGHAGAAGFLTRPEHLQKIHEKLTEYFSSRPKKVAPISVDMFVSPNLINFQLLEFLQFLGPFGNGNPEPIFGMRNVAILDYKTMGKEENHLRFRGQCEEKTFQWVAFFAEHFFPSVQVGRKLDILFTVSENVWQGEKKLQLRVKDLKENMSLV